MVFGFTDPVMGFRAMQYEQDLSESKQLIRELYTILQTKVITNMDERIIKALVYEVETHNKPLSNENKKLALDIINEYNR